MNKNNYIRLLEEENEDLREILRLTVDGYPISEIELLQNENTDLLKDINDLQYEWAKDHDKVIKQHDADCALSDMTLQEFERDIESLTGESARFRRIIKELKKEKYDMGMELEKLKKQNENLNEDLVTAEKRIKEAEENK